jgi:hypothetical protein
MITSCPVAPFNYALSTTVTSSASKFQTKIAMAVFISDKANLPYYHRSQRTFTVFQYRIEDLWKMEDKPFCCTFRRYPRRAIVLE